MKTFSKIVLGALIAAVLGVAGLALATGANTGLNSYLGFNPATGLTGAPGIPYAVGPMPVLSGAGCGTLATVQASETGGSSVVLFTANATTCTLTLTVPTISPATSPAGFPTALFCIPVDETHVATAASQTAHTTTSCTVSLTGVTSGDTILVELNGL
jgi:hypothetical protein